MSPQNIYLASMIALGFCAQWLAWRLRLPSLLLLIGFGFLLGEATRAFGHDPTQLIDNDLLFPGVSFAVAVVLFEGGLSLRVRDISETKTAVFRLVTVAILVTWAGATTACLLLGVPWQIGLLEGAILVVSGPTVIAPLLRQVRPTGRIGAVVKWEGIVNDPIGAVLAVLVFEAIVIHSTGASDGTIRGVLPILAQELIATFLIGAFIGLAVAFLLIQSLKRFWVPDFLHVAFFLAAVVGSFTLANAMAHESGLVAVTILGVALANQRTVAVKHVMEFKEHLGVLLVSALFIVLASRLRPGDLTGLGFPGLLFLAALLFVVRPAAVFISTWRTGLDFKEKLFLAMLAPRGIVAVAVTSVFALQLQSKVPALAEGAAQMVPITFLVIIGTVGFYGLLAPPLARWLGLAIASPQGVLFVGASPWVRQVAKALHEEDFRVLLVDTNRHHQSAARMLGLPVLAGDVLSEYVHTNADLAGIGRLLAVTPNDEVNTLAALEFQHVFGRAEVYQLAPAAERSEKREKPQHLKSRILFSENATFENLEQRYERGGQIKKTQLTEAFDFSDYLLKYGDSAWPLFRITDSGQLIVWTAERTKKNPPKPGDTIVALVTAEPQAVESPALRSEPARQALPATVQAEETVQQESSTNSQPEPALDPAAEESNPARDEGLAPHHRP